MNPNALVAPSELTAVLDRFRIAHGRAARIGVDLDATTADTVGGLRTWMGEKLSIPLAERSTRFPDLDQYAMWVGDDAWFVDMSDFLSHFGHAERHGFYLGLAVFDEAVATLLAMENAGCELVAVTARSDEFSPDTREWIASKGLPLATVVHSGFDKHALEGIDLFVDDAPPVVTGLLKAGRSVVVFDQTYNRTIPEHDGGTRTTGWGGPMLAAVTRLLTAQAAVD
jgi:hypothetical protein